MKRSALRRILFRKKSTRRRALRVGIVIANIVLLAGIVGFFVLQPRVTSNQPAFALPGNSEESAMSPLDQLSSANIALTVARMSNLPEAVPITNQADSEEVAVTKAATENSGIATKPQVVATSTVFARDIKEYVVLPGDTIASIASKFGITSESIRWSNNLTGSTVATGTKLVIPPLNGIVYTVSSGDSPDTIATKFNADKNKLIQFNDAEIAGFAVGQRIVVPGGSKAAVRSTASSSAGLASVRGLKAVYGYNGYDYGYCTWYVASVRSIPAGLGNAATWGIRARAMGLPTGSTPRVGAAVVTSTRGAGHVAYVEAVNDDGTIWVSEMNSHGQVSMTDPTSAGGWGRRDYKIISASGKTYIY